MIGKAIEPEIKTICKDVHGWFFAVCLVKNCSHASTNFIYDALAKWSIELGTHKIGTRVFQICFETGNKEQTLKMARAVVSVLPELIEDQFGNYLVSKAGKVHNKRLNRQVFDFIAADFIRLSNHKFSSITLETFFSLEESAMELERIITGKHTNEDTTSMREIESQAAVLIKRISLIISELGNNPYGNYVLWKILQLPFKQALKNCFLEEIVKAKKSLT